jgi:hypothetical protein
MLSAVESSATQSLRLTLTRQLAEVLLRGVSGTVYSCPQNPSETTGWFEYCVLIKLLVKGESLNSHVIHLRFKTIWIHCGFF